MILPLTRLQGNSEIDITRIDCELSGINDLCMETGKTPSSTLTDSVIIRPAALNDVGIVYDYLNQLEETILDYTHFRAIFRYNLGNPTIHYLVAEVNGLVVGFVSCHIQYLLHHCGKVGEIQELFVSPDYRNQQIGQRLIAALAALTIRENLVNLEVTTNQKRTETIRFYERALFQTTHVKLVKPIQ